MLTFVSQVNALDHDVYNIRIESAVSTSIICGTIACVLAVLLAMMLHADLSSWLLRTCAGKLHLLRCNGRADLQYGS